MSLSELLRKIPEHWTLTERRTFIERISTMQDSDLRLNELLRIAHCGYHLLQADTNTINGIVPRLTEITELAIANIEDSSLHLNFQRTILTAA